MYIEIGPHLQELLQAIGGFLIMTLVLIGIYKVIMFIMHDVVGD